MREVPLTQGFVAFVDDEDYEKVSEFSWYIHQKKLRPDCYAATTISVDGKRKEVKMHRCIMQATPNEIIDHIDGNPLNNRKENLRVANHTTNRQNSIKRTGLSQYKGVTKAYKDRWRSRITINKKVVFLGYFNNEIDAAKAYDTAAKKHFGDFARLNFPGETVAEAPQTC